jgi:hypothetical protein
VANKPKPAVGENPALSYKRLRTLIGLVALTLPITCVLAGLIDGHLESSISAYYYTKVTIVFTGTMCVIGVFLIAYRFGAVVFEDIATTLAGIAALGVAFVHTAPHDPSLSQLRQSDVHLICATVLLVLLGAISLFVFPADVPKQRPVASYWYRGLGAVIWLSLLLMVLLNKYAVSFYDRNHVFFILESLCVIAFSLAFIIKGNARLVDHEYNNVAEDPAPALQIGVPSQPTARTSSASTDAESNRGGVSDQVSK